ncbi:MAG: SpoIIE family protein phosphatase [Oscillospiraceae bacterium]|nr:SpoIIE family protein phosphatase [Oscillospiraceae bacterium]
MTNTHKKGSIRKKTQRVVFLISVTALLITATVGIVSMLRLRGEVIASGVNLGETAAAGSGQALLDQTEQNLLDLVASKASLADAKLEKFSKYTATFAAYIDGLYQQPERVRPAEVLPPDKKNENILAMQRNLANTDISFGDVAEEVALLGNVYQVFDPVIRAEQAMISTIYLGTESGVLLSYDAYSHTADTGGEEEYFNFFDSTWYCSAKKAGTLIFTDTYQDGYGRGLTISCAAPFFHANGAFAGVVCMDILISDLNQNIIDIDLGQGAYAFLLGRTGDIIASPHMEKNADSFQNITDPASEAYAVRAQLMSGKTGFIQGEKDVYYAYTPITASDWTLAIHVPAQRITAPADITKATIEGSTDAMVQDMNRQIRQTIAIFATAFLCIVCAIMALSRRFALRLTQPLVALEQDAAQISAGNLDHQATAATDDEIGDLANAFNAMTGSLRQYIFDLTAVTAEKERIGAELDVAKHIQASMLPCIFPAFPERPELDIYATMTPAKEVGGDFYDFFLTDDDHLAMVMADVSGKGVPAALFMVIAKTLLKNCAQTGLAPKAILEKVNNQLCENNDAELFVTVWLGILEISTGKLTAANAGHEYPVLKRAGGDYTLVKDKHGFVLAGMEGARYKEYELTLEPGDQLYLYTDGVAEATNASNELYGTDRMLAALNRCKDADCEALLHSMKADIDAFVGKAPQFDDITMLGIELKPRNDGFRKMQLSPTLEAMDTVTAFVEGELESAEVPMKTIAQMNIAVDEIFSNIARYSAATAATIGVGVKNGIVTLRFADNGRPYDPTEKPDPDTTLSAEERDVGGLGIFMVKKFMDAVEYEYHNSLNVLTLTKRI